MLKEKESKISELEVELIERTQQISMLNIRMSLTQDKECHLEDMLTTSNGHLNDDLVKLIGKTNDLRFSTASAMEELDNLNNNRVSDPMCVSPGKNDGIGID